MLQKEGPRKHREITHLGTENPPQGTSCQVCMVTGEPNKKPLAGRGSLAGREQTRRGWLQELRNAMLCKADFQYFSSLFTTFQSPNVGRRDCPSFGNAISVCLRPHGDW